MLCNGLNIAEKVKSNGRSTFEAVIDSWGHANCRIFEVSTVTGLLQRHFFSCVSSVALCNGLNIAESKA